MNFLAKQGFTPRVQSANVIMETVSVAFSVLVFFLIKAYHIVTAYSGVLIAVCLVSLIVSALFWKKKRFFRWLSLFSFIFLSLSIWSREKSILDNRKESEMELISDATNSAASFFDFKDLSEGWREWFPLAVKNDEVKYLLVPYGITPEMLAASAFDFGLVLKDFQGGGRLKMLNSFVPMTILDNQYYIKSKFYVAALYKPHLNKGARFEKCIELPQSVSIVMRACEAINRSDYDMARKLLQRADSLQNGAATYLLATMYLKGLGDYPENNKEKLLQLIEESISKGSRAAKVTIADMILKDTSSSTIQKAKAEDYLRRAAVLGTVASIQTVNYAEYALGLLQSYYTSTHRYRDAYRLTKKCMKAYDNPNVRFHYHLTNCVNLGRYREAISIIEEGENIGHPACYMIHAGMLSRGVGYKKDVLEAERLLRFVVDSLHVQYYEGLFDLYKEVGDTLDTKYWKGLLDIKYKNVIEE